MALFYVPGGATSSDDRWNSSANNRPKQNVPSSASRPRTPGRVRSKSQAELATPAKAQVSQEQEAYAQEFQVDPQAMQMLMEPNNSSTQPSSRYTMAPSSIQQSQKPEMEENKRASIYYGALRVPAKTAAPTPGRVKVESQPTPGGLLSSARRVEVKSSAPMFAQTPSRRQTIFGSTQATPGRLASVLASGASRMNAMSTQQQQQGQSTLSGYSTPSRHMQTSSMQSPAQKKAVVVEETYIRRLTYDDAESYEEDQHQYSDQQQYQDEFDSAEDGQEREDENDEQTTPPQTQQQEQSRYKSAMRNSQQDIERLPKPALERAPLPISQTSLAQPQSSVKPSFTVISRPAPTVIGVQSQQPSVAPAAAEPKEKRVQFTQQQADSNQDAVTEEMTRDSVEKKLIANQRRRRELMAELAKLDVEQGELINMLQTLPK